MTCFLTLYLFVIQDYSHVTAFQLLVLLHLLGLGFYIGKLLLFQRGLVSACFQSIVKLNFHGFFYAQLNNRPLHPDEAIN